MYIDFNHFSLLQQEMYDTKIKLPCHLTFIM